MAGFEVSTEERTFDAEDGLPADAAIERPVFVAKLERGVA